MDYNLLRSWLGLPPGSWPPDHYSLLGLSASFGPAAIEPRVMLKMDLLRQHQLLNPELVTEGMNRLAQALITLTDSAGRTAYDASLGLRVEEALPATRTLSEPAAKAPVAARRAPVIVAEPVIEDEDILEDAEVERLDPMTLTQEIPLPEGILVQPYEVLELEPLSRAVPFQEPRRPEPVERIIEGVPVEPVVRPWPTPPSSRRWIYSRLALMRRSLRSWDRLGPILGDPQDPIDRPGLVLLLLEAAAAVRPHLTALAGVVGGVGEPGGIVATVIRQPLLLDTIRRLLPDQRQALAIDWRRGQTELQLEYARLRRVVRDARMRVEGLPRTPAAIRWLLAYPELVLVGLALFALFLAIFRRAIGR